VSAIDGFIAKLKLWSLTDWPCVVLNNHILASYQVSGYVLDSFDTQLTIIVGPKNALVCGSGPCEANDNNCHASIICSQIAPFK
jgi:hypothetical protein